MTPPPIAARCWTLVATDGGGVDIDIDIELRCPDDTFLVDVLPALETTLGFPVSGLWSDSAPVAGSTSLCDPRLRHGAVLGVGRPAPRSWHGRPGGALELHVVGGPDAGRVVPLTTGRHLVGRGSEATLCLDDPDVSRRHAVIGVDAGGLTAADAGSTNGSRIGDDALDDRPRSWAVGETLRVGASTLALATASPPGAAVEDGDGGRLKLRPTIRLGEPVPEVDVVFPAPPSPPPRRRLAWVAVALPAVGGVLMAWLLDAPTFLFFALLSPVVALGTWLSERWSGRRSGRRDTATHARELAAAEARVSSAVRAHGRAAEAAAPDLAALVSAARRRSQLLWCRSADAPDALALRIGSGPGVTRVTKVLPDGSREREPATHLPVVLVLPETGGLGVVGPRVRTIGVLCALVAQAVTLHPPGQVDLLLLAARARLADWAWARWLPHLAPGSVHVHDLVGEAGAGAADDDALLGRLRSEVERRRAAMGRDGRPSAGWLLVVVDRALPPRLAAVLDEGRDAGVLVLTAATTASELPVPTGALLRLGGETGDSGVLSRSTAHDRTGIVVDRLPAATAATLARDLAAVIPAATPGALPDTVRLVQLPGAGLGLPDEPGRDTSGPTGTWDTRRDRLVTALGRSADGPLIVDLCRDGPHTLVAGTTGSGKSELLQTLIAGLALAHPPDRCSFLLIDYKGGAAFGPAVQLPHTVGLVTDLDGQSTARALRSLAAELSRRETILAAHGTPDIVGLPADADLGRLVIVVDEFASLAEELPEFVPGLVAIAQRGRSLGVHLVLATQRPAGVVSPEIRANCSLRICLRTTDGSDSRDVLGVPGAAHLPVGVPGRALVRAGNAAPLLFQTARVAGPRSSEDQAAPEVTRWAWPTIRSGATVGPHSGETELAWLTRVLTAHATRHASGTAHRPWRPPLPDVLAADDLDRLDGDTGGGAGGLRVGLLDHPDRQAQQPLELDLDAGGTWLAVGGPRSGRSTLLRTVLAEAVHRYGPDDLHVHVVAAGHSRLTREAAGLPHTGTVVHDEDPLRTVRLVDRLLQEVAARRAGGSPAAPARLLLLIDGWEAVSAVLDDADPAAGSTALLRLARDGAAVGVTCVLTADRAAPGGRVAAVARERLVLPLPDRADYAVAGVPPRAVPGHRPAGRALVGEDAVECQLALPRDLTDLPSPAAAAGPRLRIVELTADPELPLPARDSADDTARTLPVPLGPGGDDGHPLTVDLLRSGGLIVTGSPRSGRSSTLLALAAHLSALGVPVRWLGRPPEGAVAADDPLGPTDAAGLLTWRTGLAHPVAALLADDVGAAPECSALSALPVGTGGPRVVLVVTSTAGQLAGHYQGPVAALRRERSGLLLCPAPGDGDLLGIRLPRTPLPSRPGSGWLATDGAVRRIQVARRRI